MQGLVTAFVLHRRPYRETSFLVDLFSRDVGRISGVVRGARGGRGRKRTAAPVEPFRRMRVMLRGRASLRSIDRYEIERTMALDGDHLVGGFYLNEVLTRVLESDEPMPRLFDAYESALDLLATKLSLSIVLRSFEKILLDELGYGIDFHFDIGGEPIGEGDYLVAGDGFAPVSEVGDAGRDALIVPGAHLRAIGNLDFSDRSTARSALLIFRRALKPHLGDKPLQSRELLKPSQRS